MESLTKTRLPQLQDTWFQQRTVHGSKNYVEYIFLCFKKKVKGILWFKTYLAIFRYESKENIAFRTTEVLVFFNLQRGENMPLMFICLKPRVVHLNA